MNEIPDEIYGVPIELILFIPIDIVLIIISLIWWRLNLRKNYKLFLWVLIINLVFVILVFLNKELEKYINKRLQQFNNFLKTLYCKYLMKIGAIFIVGTFLTFWVVQILALVHQRVNKVLKKYVFRLILFIFFIYFFILNFILFGNKLIKKNECLDII
tara:strand:+ start:296 stop:769 length:474 start_codon:yes stop_codon:yes gene_type:complete